jgi:hypothetical protein
MAIPLSMPWIAFHSKFHKGYTFRSRGARNNVLECCGAQILTKVTLILNLEVIIEKKKDVVQDRGKEEGSTNGGGSKS